jgi:hypothetical protein
MTVFGGDVIYASDLNKLGTVARAVRTTAKTPITTEAGYLRIDDIPVKAGFHYRVITSNLTLDSTVDGEVGAARVRVVQSASPGTAATTSSTQIGMMRDYQDANAQAALTPLVADYFAASDGYLSVLLTAQRVTALGTFQVFASATEPCNLIVECVGTDPGDTGVLL